MGFTGKFPLDIRDDWQGDFIQSGLLEIFFRKLEKPGAWQFGSTCIFCHRLASHANSLAICDQIPSTLKPKGVGRYIRRGTRPESSENFSGSDRISPFCSMRPNVTYTVPRLSAPFDWATNWSPYMELSAASNSKITFSFKDNLGNSFIVPSVLHFVRLPSRPIGRINASFSRSRLSTHRISDNGPGETQEFRGLFVCPIGCPEKDCQRIR
jgi:hypothetical protein